MSDRRHRFIEMVESLTNKKVFTKYGFDQERDEAFQRTKILLNIHFDQNEYKALETVRIHNAVAMGAFVVTEHPLERDMDQWIGKSFWRKPFTPRSGFRFGPRGHLSYVPEA